MFSVPVIHYASESPESSNFTSSRQERYPTTHICDYPLLAIISQQFKAQGRINVEIFANRIDAAEIYPVDFAAFVRIPIALHKNGNTMIPIYSSCRLWRHKRHRAFRPKTFKIRNPVLFDLPTKIIRLRITIRSNSQLSLKSVPTTVRSPVGMTNPVCSKLLRRNPVSLIDFS